MKNYLYKLLPALRMLFSENQLVTIRQIPNISCTALDLADVLVNEHYTKSKDHILEIDAFNLTEEEDIRQVAYKWFQGHSQLPEFITIKDFGVFSIAEHASRAVSLVKKETWFLSYNKCNRMAGKVVIITGGAQGFGAGLAESFFMEGANVVIADLNSEMGIKLVSDFNSKRLFNIAQFVKTDVSDQFSVENLINETILFFGGVDVMVSNAGILRAGGIDEISLETFELMTKINYTGYFNCVKYASKVMKVQSQFTDKHFFDIIQINSKSGLRGSNKNFTYAGGKFGGIGLTQSFALELMPFNIKVNSICPGNFFDGPLWSHPETGLFVQYLAAGKVPGAKTIEEVKHFYEKQVPAGRGCEVIDVACAAFYAIEQKYETGQAIPVTGGQNMLH